MNKVLLTTVVAMLAAAPALAQGNKAKKASNSDSETAVKLETVKPAETKNKADSENIDEEITNARMRAESGSKSKLSLSTSLGYSGGNLKKPFSEERPNLLGDAETETASSLDGDLSFRYRFDKNYSATLGIGIGIYTPLQGDVSGEERQGDMSNPSVGFERAGKIGMFQSVSSIGVTQGTARAWRGINLEQVASVGQTMLTSVGETPLTVGLSVSLAYYLYGDDARAVDGRNKYTLGIYPFAEYTINDTFSLRTVFGYMNFRHRRDRGDFSLTDNSEASLWNMDKKVSYQSIGVGCSVTRDIYLYPNIQFLPTDIDIRKTNVALSAIMNAF